jgi:hypothetical protein
VILTLYDLHQSKLMIEAFQAKLADCTHSDRHRKCMDQLKPRIEAEV